MLWPRTQAKVYNVALGTEYSFSLALSLKRLDTPDLEQFYISLSITGDHLHVLQIAIQFNLGLAVLIYCAYM